MFSKELPSFQEVLWVTPDVVLCKGALNYRKQYLNSVLPSELGQDELKRHICDVSGAELYHLVVQVGIAHLALSMNEQAKNMLAFVWAGHSVGCFNI